MSSSEWIEVVADVLVFAALAALLVKRRDHKMSLVELEKLIAGLPESERLAVLKYARHRNTQAIKLALALIVIWLVVTGAILLKL